MVTIKSRKSGVDIRKILNPELNMDVIGRPGGIARAKKLSAARRKEIAQQAAQARWKTKPKKKAGEK